MLIVCAYFVHVYLPLLTELTKFYQNGYFQQFSLKIRKYWPFIFHNQHILSTRLSTMKIY